MRLMRSGSQAMTPYISYRHQSFPAVPISPPRFNPQALRLAPTSTPQDLPLEIVLVIRMNCSWGKSLWPNENKPIAYQHYKFPPNCPFSILPSENVWLTLLQSCMRFPIRDLAQRLFHRWTMCSFIKLIYVIVLRLILEIGFHCLVLLIFRL